MPISYPTVPFPPLAGKSAIQKRNTLLFKASLTVTCRRTLVFYSWSCRIYHIVFSYLEDTSLYRTPKSREILTSDCFQKDAQAMIWSHKTQWIVIIWVSWVTLRNIDFHQLLPHMLRAKTLTWKTSCDKSRELKSIVEKPGEESQLLYLRSSSLI